MDHPETSPQDSGPKKTPFDGLSRDELIIKCRGLLVIAQKAKQAKTELQTELEKCVKENKASTENIKTLQELVDSLTEQKLNFITEVDSAQSKIKALNTKCVNYEENINTYKSDLIIKDNKIADINQKLSDLDIEVTSLRRLNNRLLEENEQLLNQLTEFEASAAEFNNIGMQQREQLKKLEESVNTEDHYIKQIEELQSQIQQLESKVQTNVDYETKFNETNELYESEKAKKEKANVKLKSYKDKILKCAACINQLKNSRFILAKTVKEYSENIPKWQNDIIKASKVLDNQINELNNENLSLKAKLSELEKQQNEVTQTKINTSILDSQITVLTEENVVLKDQMSNLEQQLRNSADENIKLIADLDEKKSQLNAVTESKMDTNILDYQITVLTEENVVLKDQVSNLEQQLRNSADENIKLIADLDEKKSQLNAVTESKMDTSILDYQITVLTEENVVLKDQVSNLEQQLRNSADENIKLIADLDEKKSQLNAVTESKMDTSILDYQITVLTEENVVLKDQMSNLEQQLRNSADENIKLIADLDEKKSQLNAVTESKMDTSILDYQITVLTEENVVLKDQMSNLEQQLRNSADKNIKLIADLDEKKGQLDEKKLLKEDLNECTQKLNDVTHQFNELQKSIYTLKKENAKLNDRLHNQTQNNDELDKMHLQIRALESEKSMLVKEKLNARDNVVELDNQNKVLSDKLSRIKKELQTLKSQLDLLTQEKSAFEIKFKAEKESEINMLKCNLMAQQEQFNLLKKEHVGLQDLNGLLKEEVETLNLSLEQPKDDNLSDLNVSLQTDIAKLETKLGAYKQENASLLSEIKDARTKSKEFDNLIAEYEDAKSKLASYKSENTELLNEMKEINQALKERGEAISKLQKAVSEMEKLVETLEKDRENINQEKAELLKKKEVLESDLKNAEEKTNVKTETANQLTADMDNAMKNLSQKDDIITTLKEEIERLKQQQMTAAELPNEDMSTSTISKAEEHSRMKDLDETFEEKYTKLRIFALKLKKKLNETIIQMQQTEKDKAILEKLLSESKSGNSTDETDSSITEIAVINLTESNELEEKVKTLTVALEAAKNVTSELDKLKVELALKTQQLATEMEAHKVTKDNLEKARRDVKKKNVLSLEMEDYERSMKELSTKMEESKKKMMQMESTIDTQEGTITAMRTQIKLLEEQIKTEERQNRLVKEELQHAIEDGRDKDSMIQMKNTIISKLEQDLEDEKRKNEETDVEMTSLLTDKEKVIMALGEDKSELNNRVKKLEFKCSELNEKLKITNIELADLKTEYTSYKVRAQAVLRQNQTVDHSQEEQLKEEAAALRAQIEILTAKLTTAQEQIAEKSSEADSIRRRLTEATSEAARAQQRTSRLHADLARLTQQIESERTQNNLQVSTLTQCYKTQISELEAKLQKETELLKKQLTAAQETRKSGNVAVSSHDDANRNQYMLPVIPKDENSDGEMDINVSMIPREEGEGSESAPSPPPSKQYLAGGASGRSPVPLERLLEEGVPDDEAMDTSSFALTPDQEIAELKRRLQAQQLRVKHVTVLLSESERECARMAQLSELLKSELRRVRGATQNPHNTEYMKNVTLKFLTLPPGDERSRLVPVLQKILTLTNEETQKINAIARGWDPNPSKGWGSYLPWPGGK